MNWRDRWSDPPDENVSWANPQHEILVWDDEDDQLVIAVFLNAHWVDSYTNLFDEHPPVAFRWWMPHPGRPPAARPAAVWLRHATE